MRKYGAWSAWSVTPSALNNGRPKPISGSIETVLRHLGAPKASTVSTVFDQWAEIAGPAIAEHTEPLQIADGCLVIAVDDPAWASQLQWDAARLLEAVHAVVGDASITRLQTRVRPRR